MEDNGPRNQQQSRVRRQARAPAAAIAADEGIDLDITLNGS
jgi:hypothetical protein